MIVDICLNHKPIFGLIEVGCFINNENNPIHNNGEVDQSDNDPFKDEQKATSHT